MARGSGRSQETNPKPTKSARSEPTETTERGTGVEPAAVTSMPADSVSVEPDSGLEAGDVVDRPDEPGQLGDQGESSGLPTHEDPAVTVDRAVGSGDMQMEGPASDYADPNEIGLDADPTLDVEDLLEAGQGYGGLDGRNPASDGGGGTQPGNELPAGVLDQSAAGKIPTKQQDVLDVFKQAATEAAAAGDEVAANSIAKATADYLVEIGVKEEEQEAPADEAASGEGKWQITTMGTGSGESRQVWDDELGEVVIVNPDVQTKGSKMGSEGVQMKATGTAASSSQDGQPAPGADGANEDRGVEYDAPDLHAGFTDAYRGHKIETTLGSDVDPDPNADGGTAIGEPVTDFEPYVAEYDEGYSPPDRRATGRRHGPYRRGPRRGIFRHLSPRNVASDSMSVNPGDVQPDMCGWHIAHEPLICAARNARGLMTLRLFTPGRVVAIAENWRGQVNPGMHSCE